MKKRLSRIIFPLLAGWIMTACSATGPLSIKISAPADTDDPRKDYTRILYETLENHPAQKLQIVFEPGTYHFYPDHAAGKYHAITNHSNLYRYFAFPLIGYDSVEIEGNGAEFIFHGVITPFLIERSSGITIKNIRIDWEYPFYLQAEITRKNETTKEVGIRIDTTISKPVYRDGRLRIQGPGWQFDYLGQNITFDPATRAVAFMAETARLPVDDLYAEKIDELNYTIKWDRSAALPEPGHIVTFRGAMSENRLAPAIHISGSRNVTLQDITIHHCPGMGIIGEKSADITLDRIRVMPREGSGRIASSMADATHFCNCAGKLTVRDCLFMNMLDDGINVHGTYTSVEEIRNRSEIIASLNHFQQSDFHFADRADTLRIVDAETMLPKQTCVVKEVVKINEYLFRIITENPLSGEIKPGDGIENISWYPTEFLFSGNTIKNNRARGILLSVPSKCLIENNTISVMKNAILLEGDLLHWFESGAVRDVVIRNNRFGECSYGGGNFPLISINPQMSAFKQNEYYEKNILVTDNIIASSFSNLIQGHGVYGLTIQGNKFIKTDTYDDPFRGQPIIRLHHCGGTKIIRNQFDNLSPAIEVDLSTFNDDFQTDIRNVITEKNE